MDEKGEYFHKNIGEIASIEATYTNPIKLGLRQYFFQPKIWAARKQKHTDKLVFQQKNHQSKHVFFDEETKTAWKANGDGLLSIRFKTRFFLHVFNSSNNKSLSRYAFPIADHRVFMSAGGKNAFYDHQNHSFAFLEKRSFFRSFCKAPTESFLIEFTQGSLLKLNLDGSVQASYPFSFPAGSNFYDSQVMGDQVYFGAENGLYQFDPQTGGVQKLSPTRGFEALDSTQVHFFEKRNENQFYIGTQSGLYLYDIKKGVQEKYGQGEEDRAFLPANRFFEISKAKAGGYWLATMNGLIHWDPQKETDPFRHYSTANGLPTNEVLAAFEDDYGFVWLPTPHGLVQFQESTQLSKTYLQSDGLTHSGFQDHTHARLADGTLVLGTYNGFNIFHPKDFRDADLSPHVPLAIHAFEQHSDKNDRIENRLDQIIDQGEIILQPGDKLFNIQVALTDYREADKHRFAYQIAGYQEEWQEGRSNLIRISGLPYGNYVLKIKGRLQSGLFVQPMLEIPIRVLKPFYLRTWFIGLAFFSFLLSVFILFKWRERRMKERQKELESSIADATETIRHQNEELKNLDKVKSRFFANVSHELRTPLTLILGPLSSVLKGQKLAKKDASMVKLSQSNAKGLLKLVNEILDLTKLDSGKLSLEEEPVDFYSFLQRVLGAFDGMAQQKKISYEFNYEAAENLQLKLDEKKVEKLLNNLLSNAFKFTPAGGRILVQTKDQGEQIKVSVQDNGRGIHPDDLPHVFDRYYQSSQPDVPKEGGTGIGLSLSMEFAKLMKGSLSAESRLGEGSIMHFEFPKKVLGSQTLVLDGAVPDALSSADHERAPVLAMPDNENWRIQEAEEAGPSRLLLVEDNENLRTYIQLIIGEKYELEMAENGKVAWEYLTAAKELPDLIISDIMMPEMDGYQLLKKLKDDMRFRGTPVIMLTALADLKDKLKALRIGVDDYMTKPFEEEELLARIDNLLRHRYWRAQFQQEIETGKEQEPADTSVETTEMPQISKSDQEWQESLEQAIFEKIDRFDFSIEQLARDMATSRWQLNRRIKQLIGLTSQAYLQEIRLNHARTLLEQKECRSVKELTQKVGAKDIRHFSRLFNKRFGKLPSEYLV